MNFMLYKSKFAKRTDFQKRAHPSVQNLPRRFIAGCLQCFFPKMGFKFLSPIEIYCKAVVYWAKKRIISTKTIAVLFLVFNTFRLRLNCFY